MYYIYMSGCGGSVVIAICVVIGLIIIYLIIDRVYSRRDGYFNKEAYGDIISGEGLNRMVGPVANVANDEYPDIIMQYDMEKMVNPLVEPSRRVPRQDIQPVILKDMIDIPTRGTPDSYSEYGLLVKQCGKDPCDNDNKLLRLFGRQEYPGSVRYEYYTIVNTGNDQIKIPIRRCYRNELYNDDSVKIDELSAIYKVRLYRFDAPRYYPDVI